MRPCCYFTEHIEFQFSILKLNALKQRYKTTMDQQELVSTIKTIIAEEFTNAIPSMTKQLVKKIMNRIEASTAPKQSIKVFIDDVFSFKVDVIPKYLNENVYLKKDDFVDQSLIEMFNDERYDYSVLGEHLKEDDPLYLKKLLLLLRLNKQTQFENDFVDDWLNESFNELFGELYNVLADLELRSFSMIYFARLFTDLDKIGETYKSYKPYQPANYMSPLIIPINRYNLKQDEFSDTFMRGGNLNECSKDMINAYEEVKKYIYEIYPILAGLF